MKTRSSHQNRALYITDLVFLCATATLMRVNCTDADCGELTCVNGGQCKIHPDTNSTSGCLCPPDVCGDTCQYQSPCHNGGTCISAYIGAIVTLRCECPANFIGYRCQLVNPCSSDPCPPTKRCRAVFNNYRCDCLQDGYHGQHCDIFDRCSESPCQNNGVCSFTGNNSYYCNCDPDGTTPGFYGDDCELYDVCLTSPCKNGGMCIRDPQGQRTTATCLCDAQHYGDLCQHRDQCTGSPCFNNGTCLRLEGGDYECKCLHGYFGSTCLLSACSTSYCRNNGTCSIDEYGGAQCECTNEYYGIMCELLNSCLESSICNNGGYCTDINGADYRCACSSGWTGVFCDFQNPCVHNPCPDNHTCSVQPFGLYTCSCHSDAASCMNYELCSDDLCKNGGLCKMKGNFDYECDCTPDGLPTGYYGENCGNHSSCPEVIPSACSNHGECQYTDTAPGYECVRCDSGYYGNACQRYDGCASSPCRNHQACISLYIRQSFRCNCSQQYKGTYCEIPVRCDDSSTAFTVSTKGVYFWPPTLIKETASLPCQVGDGYATRKCEAVVSGGMVLATFWFTPDTSACETVNFTKKVAENLTHYLVHTTSNALEMQEEEVTSSTELILAIIIHTYYDQELANDMMLCISNLLEVNETVLRDSSVESDTNTKLLSVIDSYAKHTILDADNSTAELVTDNIQIKIQDIPLKKALEAGSSFHSSLGNSSGASITVPAEAFSNKETGLATDGTDSIRLNYVVLANTKLFISNKEETLADVTDGYAVSANIIGKPIKGLVNPVTIGLPIERDAVGRIPKCTFWNEQEGKWDTSGLKLISSENGVAVCESTHLTYFAVIMDPGPSKDISATHVMILSLITRVGINFTLLGLLLTFITYLLFKQLRGTRSGKILIHLCVSLFGLNLVFLLDSFPSLTSSSNAFCLACAILLHYFVLTSFMWMAMEAVNMYMALVKVFVRGSTGSFMTKCIIVSWGVPVGIVTAAVASGPTTHYGRVKNTCLVSRKSPYVYYISYLSPCCIILAINIIVFGMVLHAVSSCRNKQLQTASSKVAKGVVRKTQIGCALSVTFLLGLTWIFGLFALGEATLVFQYIFTIINTLQGFFIFLFRCALYPDALRCWRVVIAQRSLNPRKTPINTAVRNNTCQHSQKITNNSTKLVPLTTASDNQQSPVASATNAGYEPSGMVGYRLGVPPPTSGRNGGRNVDCYQYEMSTWEQIMKLRDVTINDIKPRNDVLSLRQLEL